MKNKKPVPKKPKRHDNDDESIIREIEEAVKKEQYAKFAKKHAGLVAVVIFILAAVLIGGKAWKDKQHENAKAAGEKIYLALNNEDFDPALLASTASDDVNQISELTKARLLAENDKNDEAEKLYSKIAANENYDAAIRELATLNRISLQINSGVNNKQIKSDLELIANNGKVFKYTAQEMLAAYELQFGKPENAKKIFEKLIADKNTPSGIMLRAKQINSNI